MHGFPRIWATVGAPVRRASIHTPATRLSQRSQECLPLRDALCFTIDKPFFTAYLCGKCLDNVHSLARNDRCFEIGGSQMKPRQPCG